MKYITTVLVLLLGTFCAHSQWLEVPLITTQDLFDVSFATDDIGYVTGSFGLARKTVDGGVNWINVDPATVESYFCIYALNPDTAYVGRLTLSRTDNGGQSWAPVQNIGGAARDILFLNDSVGFVTRGNIYKTIDGGDNWFEVYDTGMRELVFPSDSVGYCIGNNDSDSTGGVMKTIDGGDSWFGTPLINRDMRTLSFINDSTGFAFSYNDTMFVTIDGGITWGIRQHNIYGQGASDMIFVDEYTAWMCTGSGGIYHTINGGYTWNIEHQTASNSLTQMTITENDMAYVVGLDGMVIKRQLNVGIKAQNNASSFEMNVYPNPTSGMFRISLDTNEPASVSVFNSVGTLVYSADKACSLVTLDLSNEASGIYFVVVRVGIEVRRKKVVLSSGM